MTEFRPRRTALRGSNPFAAIDTVVPTGMRRVIVKLPIDQFNALYRHCRETGTSISAFCRDAATEALPRISRGRPTPQTEQHDRVETARIAAGDRRADVLKTDDPPGESF